MTNPFTELPQNPHLTGRYLDHPYYVQRAKTILSLADKLSLSQIAALMEESGHGISRQAIATIIKRKSGNKLRPATTKTKPPRKSKVQDLTGQTFGNLTALLYEGASNWLCVNTVTGEKSTVHRANLKRGKSKGIRKVYERKSI
jgi:hypothetical protein